MSRLGYSDEEDHPGQFALWAANQARALGSRKGLASLAELRDALEAMPAKRLVANVLSEGTDVCTLGALISVKRPDLLLDLPTDACGCSHLRSQHTEVQGECAGTYTRTWGVPEPVEAPCGCDGWYVEDYEQGDKTLNAAVQVGVPPAVARHLIHLNDDDLEGMTPEGRYVAVLRWVNRQLEQPVTPKALAADYTGMGW